MAVLLPSIVQLHGITMGMCGTYYGCSTAVPFLKTYVDNSPVEHLLPVRSKRNTIIAHNLFDDGAYIEMQAVKTI